MRCVDKLDRYKAVIRLVARKHFPSKAEIIKYINKVQDDSIDDIEEGNEALEEGESKSSKSFKFKRLLDTIDKEYGISIKWNASRKGYGIVNDDEDVVDLVGLFEMANSIGFTASSLKDLKKMKDFIQVSNSNDFESREYIAQLLDLCMYSKEAIFEYEKYGEEIATKRKVQPYQIREFQGQWYLIGIEPDLTSIEPHHKIVKFRAYGLDRMRNLRIGVKFYRDKDQAFIKHYADVIGIVNGYQYQEGTNIVAEIIRFRVDKYYWNYIDSLPWHHSQKQVDKTGDYVEFELFVKPTSELVRLILQWSPQVKVLKPKGLKDKVRAELQKSLSLYA